MSAWRNVSLRPGRSLPWSLLKSSTFARSHWKCALGSDLPVHILSCSCHFLRACLLHSTLSSFGWPRVLPSWSRHPERPAGASWACPRCAGEPRAVSSVAAMSSPSPCASARLGSLRAKPCLGRNAYVVSNRHPTLPNKVTVFNQQLLFLKNIFIFNYSWHTVLY